MAGPNALYMGMRERQQNRAFGPGAFGPLRPPNPEGRVPRGTGERSGVYRGGRRQGRGVYIRPQTTQV